MPERPPLSQFLEVLGLYALDFEAVVPVRFMLWRHQLVRVLTGTFEHLLTFE